MIKVEGKDSSDGPRFWYYDHEDQQMTEWYKHIETDPLVELVSDDDLWTEHKYWYDEETVDGETLTDEDTIGFEDLPGPIQQYIQRSANDDGSGVIHEIAHEHNTGEADEDSSEDNTTSHIQENPDGEPEPTKIDHSNSKQEQKNKMFKKIAKHLDTKAHHDSKAAESEEQKCNWDYDSIDDFDEFFTYTTQANTVFDVDSQTFLDEVQIKVEENFGCEKLFQLGDDGEWKLLHNGELEHVEEKMNQWLNEKSTQRWLANSSVVVGKIK